MSLCSLPYQTGKKGREKLVDMVHRHAEEGKKENPKGQAGGQ